MINLPYVNRLILIPLERQYWDEPNGFLSGNDLFLGVDIGSVGGGPFCALCQRKLREEIL